MALEVLEVVRGVVQEGAAQAWEGPGSVSEEQAEGAAAAAAGLPERLSRTRSLHGTPPCLAAVLSLHCPSRRRHHHLLLQKTPLSLCLPQEFPGLQGKNQSFALDRIRGGGGIKMHCRQRARKMRRFKQHS